MNIEKRIFSRYVPKFDKLINCGFSKIGDDFCFEKIFHNSEFKAVITVSSDGKITGNVQDLLNEDDFLPLRIKNQEGGFVGEIQAEYEKILMKIREEGFEENLFIYPQANRICEKIKEKFKDNPVFPWEQETGYGVFKNPDSKKWYALIMNIDYSKIDKKKSGEIEVINVKLDENIIPELIMQKGFFPAWHMNKKTWVTIILNDTLSDRKIMDCIAMSHEYTVKKSKKK